MDERDHSKFPELDELVTCPSFQVMIASCRLQSGVEPWKSTGSTPQICIETDNKVTHMSVANDVAVVGSEEGRVEAWSLQGQEQLWQVGSCSCATHSPLPRMPFPLLSSQPLQKHRGAKVSSL